MTSTINIEKKRGDTKRHTFTVYQANGVDIQDIGDWSDLVLTVDPEKRPVDALNNLEQMTGFITTDGSDGKLSFVPSGTIPIGRYYYDVQGIDGNNEKTTPVEGKYKVTQDVTKD